MKDLKGCFSHNSDEWRTPKKLYEELNQEFHFDIDLASTDENALCKEHYTKEFPFNFSYQPHNKNIWCNPPYSNIKQFMEYAQYLMELKNNVVMLIPSRTDTKWFHKYVYKKNNVEIRFIKGRLKFNDGVGSAPFPSMIVIFRGLNNELDTHKNKES